jgi:TPP-dependent pyruvate/acetoin dehydrogenase alpha subunit
VVDGNDVREVRRYTQEAAARARSGDGPTLLECKTVRWERHSGFSSGGLDPEAAQRWRKTDPLPRLRASLLEEGLSPKQIEAVEDEVRDIIAEAVEFARTSPLPAPESVFEGIYA